MGHSEYGQMVMANSRKFDRTLFQGSVVVHFSSRLSWQLYGIQTGNFEILDEKTGGDLYVVLRFMNISISIF